MLTLGFIIARTLHHDPQQLTAAAAADASEMAEKMDVDSSLQSAISSAVLQLGELNIT